MKRIFLLLTCLGALLLSACGGDSKLPTPTGKGAVRAINAIPGSPEIVFLIEERPLGPMRYKQSTNSPRYDDFSYSFNFDIRYPGDAIPTRVASEVLKVEKDREHIFLVTGDITAPTITVWNGDIREWVEGDTVFEARFSHGSASLGEIDVYFDEPGTVLGTNAPVATLSLGEIGGTADYEAGPYVMTVTAAGDLDTVYYTSSETDLLPQFAHIITVFDGDGNDTAPVAVRSMTAVGNPLFMPDANYPPETRFIHSAYTLETVDIYNDDLLTNLFAENLPFSVATPDLETTLEAERYYVTPADSQATVLFEYQTVAQNPGSFTHIYLIIGIDNWTATRVIPDRSTSLTSVKLRIFHAAANSTLFEVYLKDRDEPLSEDDFPSLLALYTARTGILRFKEGSYDIYLTEQGNKTEIAAPYQIDVALGDIVDLIAVDTVDPAVVELIEVPVP
jgi:hypothetical protein